MRPHTRVVLALGTLVALAAPALPAEAQAPDQAPLPVLRSDLYHLYRSTTQVIIPGPGILANDDIDLSAYCLRRIDYNTDEDENNERRNNSRSGGFFRISDGCSPGGAEFGLVIYRPPALDGIFEDHGSYCAVRLTDRTRCATEPAHVTFRFGDVPLDAHDDRYRTAGSEPYSVHRYTGLLRNDENPHASPAIHPLITAGPPSGTSVDLSRDGAFTFTPNSFTGVATFEYCLVDDSGDCQGEAATVTIEVGSAGDAHVDDTTVDVPVEAVSTIDPATRGLHRSADWLTIEPPRFGRVLAERAKDAMSYVPQDGYAGLDQFRVCTSHALFPASCGSNIATITVNVVGDPRLPPPPPAAGKPQSLDDGFQTHRDVTVAPTGPVLLGNDTVATANEVVAIAAPGHGALDLRSDGSFSYVPATGFTGVDEFTYCLVAPGPQPPTNPKSRRPAAAPKAAKATLAAEVGDPSASARTVAATQCSGRPGRVRITVLDGVVPPVPGDDRLRDDVYQTPFQTRLDVPPAGVLANDTIAVAGETSVVTPPQHGTVAQAADGSLAYTPESGFTGVDTYTYCVHPAGDHPCRPAAATAEDPTAATALTVATVTITVAPAQPADPPVVAPPPVVPPPVVTAPPLAPPAELVRTGSGTWWWFGLAVACLALGRNYRSISRLVRRQ